MGSARKEMMPHPNKRMAITATRKRLLSAKSTKPRIIARSLLLGVLQDEGVLHYALSGLNARAYLLHIDGKHISAGHCHPPELSGVRGHVHPVAIVQVQDRGSRNHRMHLALLAVEGGFDEHTEAHEPGVLHLQPDLGGAEIRVEGGTDVAQSPPENLVGESVQTDLRVFAKVDKSQIVLVNVADDPHVGQVRDGKCIRRCQALSSRRGSHLLVCNHTGSRRHNVHHRRWMFLVDRKST